MCGACGVAAPSHWSAPFLASLPARATAARAVTAMIGAAPAVVGVPGGFLIRRPTGAVTLVPHLGAVWQALDRYGVPRPVTAAPPLDVTGPVTLPPVRTTMLDVQLALPDTLGHRPGAEELLDGRGTEPHVLTERLRALAASTEPRAVCLLLDFNDVPVVLPHLAANPTHPFQLRLGPAGRGRTVGVPSSATRTEFSAAAIPALLAWVASREGRDRTERFATGLPATPDCTFQLEMLHGVVTRCALQPSS